VGPMEVMEAEPCHPDPGVLAPLSVLYSEKLVLVVDAIQDPLPPRPLAVQHW